MSPARLVICGLGNSVVDSVVNPGVVSAGAEVDVVSAVAVAET
jgi:hypothetical protein